MFHALGRWVSRFPGTICLGWLLVGAALSVIAPNWDTQSQDDDVRFVPDRFTSVRAHHLLEQAFPQDLSACKALFVVEREDRPLSDHDFHLLDDIAQLLEHLKTSHVPLKITKVETYRDSLVGCRLTSADRQCSLVLLNLGTPYLAAATQTAVDSAERVVRARLAKEADPPSVTVTGAAGIGRDLTKAAGASLDGTTWATVALVVVVLLAVYRAPLLALVPLVTIAVSVWVSLKLLALATLIPGVHLVSISKVFAIVILYGAGTDYCLFLVSRYREELHKGAGLGESTAKAVGGVGLALVASAGTVMVGLGMMGFAEFAKVRYAGPAIAVGLAVATLAALTLTPALLRLLGSRAFWPGRPPRKNPDILELPTAETARFGIWDRLSRVVARRPAFVGIVAGLILLPFVLLGLAVRPSYRATGELSPKAESLRGLKAIQRHFNPGEVGPITVLLASAEDWRRSTGTADVDHLSRGFALLPNVAEVRSLTQPLGWCPPDLRPADWGDGVVSQLITLAMPLVADFQREMRTKAADHYVAEIERNGRPHYVTRIDVVLKSDPFDAASAVTLKAIRTWLDEELPRTAFTKSVIQSECHGVTATAVDLADVTESDRARVNSLVVLAVFLILAALVRKLWLATYLLATVLASYYAALGATALLGWLTTGTLATVVDWRVPFFLFTILIAVGEDYNILLIHRAIQERRRFGGVEGMRRALSFTGGAITSCGLIMAGTFATLMLAGLNTLTQIGFALAFGVLVDTFVVRPFLVPAVCMLFWRASPPTATSTPNVPLAPDADAFEKLLGPGWRRAA